MYDDINFNYGATFPTDLIKCAKTRVNQKINFLCDTKRQIRKIVINNGRNRQIFHKMREKRDEKLLFKGNVLSRLLKPVGLLHECTKTNFKYQKP